MRAVVCRRVGDPSVLAVAEVADPPPPGPGELLIDVAASGVNRADLLQRQGHYPPPPGASDIIGMECAGTVAAVGPDVTDWTTGDRVCALLAGGGYATRVLVPAGQALPIPERLTDVEAAALPEAACTVWSNVFMAAGLQPGEILLVHGGSSGIGTLAIQLAAALGAKVAVTVGSADKAAYCLDLGATLAINYREQDFVAEVRRTFPAGADVVLDIVGARYLPRNVDVLAPEGRLVVIGLQGGARAELDLGALLAKRAAIIATTLRSRPAAEKAAIVASVRQHVWPLVEGGEVRPVVHATFDLSAAADAHRLLESSTHRGKVVLTSRA